jgi:hypothetical protein
MKESIALFENNKYVCIKGLIQKESCNLLTQKLKEAVKNKETQSDVQCPSSESIYGYPMFDKLLEDIRPLIEQHTNKKLLPTYSYARLYKPDEVLKVHRDRPSCEISVTVTLGFEGDKWPIYIADGAEEGESGEFVDECPFEKSSEKVKLKNISKVEMDIGDAIIYRGGEKWHWRNSYKEGKWQAQIFLHYVDAEGEYTEWKYDKRPALGQPADTKNTNHNKVYNVENYPDYAIIKNALSDNFCDLLIKETLNNKDLEIQPPYIGGGDVDIINRDVRDVERIMLDPHKSASATLFSLGMQANLQFWKYNITHANQSEFLKYSIEGRYKPHVDTVHSNCNETRKLTALVFLNDDFEGGKFFINANGEINYPPQTKGTAVIFPSYMVHGVETVTKGTRYSIVNWLVGPYFK